MLTSQLKNSFSHSAFNSRSRYIHLNPVRAGMVGKPEEYHWSHYKDYIGLNKSPDWLNTDFVLNLFAKKVTVARAEYRRFVESMVDMEYESPLKEVFASTILGSRDFINEIGDYFGIGVSGVSQASRRVGMQIKDDKGLKKKVNKLILDQCV